jgi:hypothetical protein
MDEPKEIIQADLMRDFLQNQAKDLELKAQELEFKKQQDSNSFEFGKLSLEAQARDRGHEREFAHKKTAYTYWLVGAVCFGIGAVIICAMYFGDKDVAMEIIKAIFYALTGGVGGYGIAKSTNKNQSEEQ